MQVYFTKLIVYDGKTYQVEVGPSGSLTSVQGESASVAKAPASSGTDLNAPLAGNIFKILVSPGDEVVSGDVVIILEAMKMETEVRVAESGVVSSVYVNEGDSVQSGQPLISLG